MALFFEFLAVSLVFLLAWRMRRPRRSYLRRLTRRLRPLTRRRWAAVLLVGLAAFVLNAALSLFVRMPEPRYRDEFSYLLAADTFAAGRLTNPTHPLWESFDAGEVIQRPTYQSKYPPAQGLILALGLRVGGHPIVGVWLSAAFAGAALCWMLQAWVPPRYALLGASLAVFAPGIVVWWGQSYWGGNLAMAGGALLFGALRRIVRRPHLGYSLLLGLGLLLLANTRPYEGFVASIPSALILLVWLVRKKGPPLADRCGKVVLPIAVVLALGGFAMAYYNGRVTGAWWRMPYQVWQNPQRQQPPISTILFAGNQPLPGGWLTQIEEGIWRLFLQWKFYIRVVLLVPLLVGLGGWRARWDRFAILTCAAVFAAVAFEWSYGFPHYTAPVASLLFALVVQGLRRLCAWRALGKMRAELLVGTVPVIVVVSLIVYLVGQIRYSGDDWSLHRARFQAELENTAGRHLVIVRYGPKHPSNVEWISNRADIDSAKVVWAKHLDTEQNRRLLEYFKDRHVWIVEADAVPVRLLAAPSGTGELGPSCCD